MKRAIFVLLVSNFFTLFALSAAAQDSLRTWSLAECQDFAIQNSPRARIQTFTNRKYNQDLVAAAGAVLPSISASSGAGWSFGRSIDPQTNTYNNTSNFNNSYGIQAQMVVFGGLRTVNTLRAARLAQLRGTQELQQARDEIALETLRAFVNVVYCTEAVELARQQLEESRRNLYSTERQAELGLKSAPDVAQFEAEVAGFEYTLTRQLNTLATAVLELKTQMNYPIDEPLHIEPEIASSQAVTSETAAAIFDNVRETLPAAQVADYQLRDSHLSLAIARGAYYPTVSAYGSLGSNYFKNLTSNELTERFRDQLRHNHGTSVGLSLSIPIFDGLSQRARVNRARNDLRIAEETHAETLRKIQTEIEQAVMDVEGGAKEWAGAVRKMEATEKAHRANQRKFEEGLVSALELQNSTNQLLLSRTEELDARLRYEINCWLLDFYKRYGY